MRRLGGVSNVAGVVVALGVLALVWLAIQFVASVAAGLIMPMT